MDKKQNPWDRLPDEPNNWYDRFEVYRRMGPSRSILGAVNKIKLEGSPNARKAKSLPQTWQIAKEKWRWIERAEAWDEHNRELARQQDAQKWDQDQKRARLLRATTIQALQGMLGRVINAEAQGNLYVDPKTLLQLSQASSIIFKESRLEFGEPTEITDVQSGGKPLSPIHSMTGIFQSMAQREKHGRSN